MLTLPFLKKIYYNIFLILCEVNSNMSKKLEKNGKTPKKMVQKNRKADGTEEYYITTAPQKTLTGKIIIWTLVALMALGSVGSLIVAIIQIMSK